MKKFLLGLFLILGVVAFAGPEDLPSYVNKQKFEENGYQIRVNKVDTFTIVGLLSTFKIKLQSTFLWKALISFSALLSFPTSPPQ